MDWLALAIAVGSALLSGGLTFGLLKGDVKALRERLERAEKDLGKLDESKASRELVGGLAAKIDELEERLDKRFDRLEVAIGKGPILG